MTAWFKLSDGAKGKSRTMIHLSHAYPHSCDFICIVVPTSHEINTGFRIFQGQLHELESMKPFQ